MGVQPTAAMGASCQRRARVPRQVYKMHLVEGRAATGPAVDSARQNLASTFVNAFVNAGFGTDKLMTGACPLGRGALQTPAERLPSVTRAQEALGVRCRRSRSAAAWRQQRAALLRAQSRASCCSMSTSRALRVLRRWRSPGAAAGGLPTADAASLASRLAARRGAGQ